MFKTFLVNETETTSSNPVIETNEPVPVPEIVVEEHDSDDTGDTIDENENEPPPQLEIPKAKPTSDDGKSLSFLLLVLLLFFK